MKARLAALSAALTAQASVAHPGHGGTDAAAPLHYLMEPEHLLWLGGALLFGLCALWWRRAARARERG